MSDLFDASDLHEALKRCPQWEHEDAGISRTFEFEEFADAIDFVNDLAEIAEKVQHHPEIQIRYNKVRLVLITHDAGGITEHDIALAQRIDNLVD